MNLPVLNQQPVEKRVDRPNGALEVVDVFLTLQGEGPFVGTPAVFVRMAGCDLQCPSCDTDYTTNRRLLTPAQLLTEVDRVNRDFAARLVVLTGGEPFRQACGRFITTALSVDYRVQVETNGTLYDDSVRPALKEEVRWRKPRITVVCSPKTGSLAVELVPYINHLKYVVEAGKVDPTDGLPTDSLNFGVRPARPWDGFDGEVFVSPMDSKDEAQNCANRQAAVASCLKFGYRLSLQTHKLLELP